MRTGTLPPTRRIATGENAMKIEVIGGGPSGLYFSILMKKSDPSHEIKVYELNRADDTFGFGVVFSAETLKHFRDYDEVTYEPKSMPE